MMKRNHLSMAIAVVFCMTAGSAFAQDAASQDNGQATTKEATAQRANASSTSNTTTSNDTKRVQQLNTVTVQAQSLTLGGGLMSVQTAPKAVSTITRDAIEKASPGANFTQMIGSIPGVNAATDDVTGLANGHYSIRGFDSSDIGMTVNGAPITDTGSYSVYATEYGDSENMGDITVLQGIPDIDMPDSGASGGHIAWATIDPSHNAGLDFTQSLGNNDYRRTFIRFNTGDTGPVRSWLSYSNNSADKWRGQGDMNVTKVDGKSIWTINDDNSISASLQYNRQNNDSYRSLTKAQVAQNGYYYDYLPTWSQGSSAAAISNNTYYYGLRTNPYKSYMFSLDGEFKLSDSTRLSVVPYFWYGNGGGGAAATVTESTAATNRFGYANQDVNNDGAVINNTKGVVYSYSAATTYRPGVIAKINQDFGLDNSLEYGVWYERSRKSQDNSYGQADSQGNPADLWANSAYIYYPSGRPQLVYDEYTNTEIKKGFVTDNWTPNDQWTFTAGVSYLWTNRNGFVWEYPGSTAGTVTKQQNYSNVDKNWNKFLPTAGIKFQLDERNQFFIGSGKTFRAPTNTVALLNALDNQADANKPETAWNTDLGYRFYGDALSASADIYRSNYNNKQQSAYDQATGYTYYTSVHRMHMQGFNGELSYKLAQDWTAYASYTYTQAKIVGSIDGGSGDGIYPTNGKTMPDTARNIGNVSIAYDDGSHLWASLSARVTSSLYGDYMNTERVGGFATLNLNAGYKFGSWDWLKNPYVKLNVSNLTDRKAFSYVSSAQFLATSMGSLYTSSPTYGLLQPRAYMVTFGASFF
ncbi:TonB-dependent receptor [Dyella sp. ASV21]|uniref:TonB-dependent receptor n=1 Tax=Dyella sp. ASV21 TaxID=2795114 RepID=UPI001E4E00B7|nr:TonB-dependent receptor [Dyella sp. ASV21]